MVDTNYIQQNMVRNTSKGIDDFYLASFNGTTGGCRDHEEEDTCEGSNGKALLAAFDHFTWRVKPPHENVQPAEHAEENDQLQYEVAAEALEPQDRCLLKIKIILTDCQTGLFWDCQNLWLFHCQAVKLSDNWTKGIKQLNTRWKSVLQKHWLVLFVIYSI